MLDLLTGKADEPTQTKDVNVALVPLGMPLLAGPGAIVLGHPGRAARRRLRRSALRLAPLIVAMHVVLWLACAYSLVIIRIIKDGGAASWRPGSPE
ncbi:hypothetical protein SMICM304S_05492 [Streptomyces microflavus]